MTKHRLTEHDDAEPLVSRLRSLERDHGPDGWPAVQMRDISALLDTAEAFARLVALYESEQDDNSNESRPDWVRRALRCIE